MLYHCRQASWREEVSLVGDETRIGGKLRFYDFDFVGGATVDGCDAIQAELVDVRLKKQCNSTLSKWCRSLRRQSIFPLAA